MKYKVKKDDLEVNLAPMIDVVFLLLIFFMVASTLNLREVKSNIQLPDTKVVETKKETEINLSITKDGQIYLGKAEVSLEELENRLKSRFNQANKNNLTIFADKEVPFQKVVKVMDVAKRLKVSNLSFALHRTNN
ncbi:ExbD/TolR family protein [Selenihalanaerobacter shriftii]|uniref:Biopolymer transport protein ExbD n=1 Tax=Selenihalanaerobacter shriftii TaxID=142842 RepID=A0A1T4K155_9FIRM|nr:biopolymer transporter ExbD [Selenihalanaerobacter shriftii]SJZ36151.1 biopolymer transport protein ExbD [Selenihalanaerobacter shriftii]